MFFRKEWYTYCLILFYGVVLYNFYTIFFIALYEVQTIWCNDLIQYVYLQMLLSVFVVGFNLERNIIPW